MSNFRLMALVIGMATLAVIIGCFQPALAKRWTVTQRMEKISAEITEGKKAVELTDKEAESLRKELADIKGQMEKMQAKNAGQLSLPDQRKIHERLTDLSVRIVRLRLNNVYKD